MELEPNPFAAPAIVSESKAEPRSSAVTDLPDLPLVFRQGIMDHLVILPIGFLTGGSFVACLWGAISAFDETGPGLIVIPLGIISLIAGAGFLGCLSASICSVRVDKESIRVQQFLTRHVDFKDIQSWHFHPVMKCVVISFFSGRETFLLSNMVMTPRRNQLVGKVLEHYVGPAAGA